MKLTTLCYIETEHEYLMMHRTKKEHDINRDKWIGVGGKFEPGESPDECLLREVREETGLELTDYRFRGIITFKLDENETEYMHLFTATGFRGTIGECDEGELKWVNKKDVFSLQLWEGDRIFLARLLEDDTFFSLKLVYQGDTLVEAIMDGRKL